MTDVATLPPDFFFQVTFMFAGIIFSIACWYAFTSVSWLFFSTNAGKESYTFAHSSGEEYPKRDANFLLHTLWISSK